MKFKSLIAALALTVCLSGCTIYENWKTENVTMVVTDETIVQLEDFPNLVSADLSGSTCYEAIEAYMEAHPEVSVTYTIEVLGTHYAPDTTELDLSEMSAAQIPQMLEEVTRLTEVTAIRLTAADGSVKLSPTDVKCLLDALPKVEFTYSFDLFGQTVDLNTERVEFVEVEIGDSGEAELRAALDILRDCTYFKLDRCGFSNEVLDRVNKDYPDTKVVWRVFYGNNDRFNALTDETVVRSTHYLLNRNIENMKYLTDVVYMDIGHNEYLTDISFCNYMPNLKLIIVSGSQIRDISPLANHNQLEFVELAFCTLLSDLSPLASCPNLKYLNIANGSATDLSPLDNLPLERFNCMINYKISDAELARFVEVHPNCWSCFEGEQPYGAGWRYQDNNYTPLEYYATMRQIFHYDEPALLNGYEWDKATENDPW